MKDKQYKHWKNDAQLGQTMFVSTTCLDFAHLLIRSEMRERMAVILAQQCVRHGGLLRAFVVMSNHVHFIVTAPQGRSVSWLVQRIKSKSALELLPLLNLREKELLQAQTGLNQRSFWRVSF